LTRKQQGELHATLLVAAVLVMGWNLYSWGSPLLPDISWRPSPTESPVMHIILLLSMSVGIPLFLLSSTAPLLQNWYAREDSRAPYFLYALSNAGSLLGLLSYPSVAEPLMRVRAQAIAWAIGFITFGTICAWTGLRGRNSEGLPVAASSSEPQTAPTLGRIAVWFALSACGSFLLLATTNLLTQDMTPIPLLWVLPLCVYLLTFIVAFERERWYSRAVFHPLLVVAVGLAIYALQPDAEYGIKLLLAIFLLFLFAACMVCHGELARSKPDKSHLTLFYLVISVGGAFGGFLVSIGAPIVFNKNIEFPLGVFAVLALLLAVLWLESGSWMRTSRWKPAVALIALVAVGFVLAQDRATASDQVLAKSRNFYGALRVVETEEMYRGQPFRYRRLLHGRVTHGTQIVMPGMEGFPTAYYAPNSGAALAIATQTRDANTPVRVGVIGLGIGTLAAYARPVDYYRFYEINSKVVDYAAGEGNYFSFLSRSFGKVDAVVGDARSNLEAEAKLGDLQQFDVFIVDAFNGDAIPIHLLTREAIQVYRQHLRGPDSVIAIHISNRYVDLEPVVAALAKDGGLHAAMVHAPPHPYLSLGSHWALLSEGNGLSPERIAKVAQTVRANIEGKPVPVWTDDYSSIYSLLMAGNK
jgi:spermidine synthase